jgi:hypothetical protein
MKMVLQKVGVRRGDLIELVQNRDSWPAIVGSVWECGLK